MLESDAVLLLLLIGNAVLLLLLISDVVLLSLEAGGRAVWRWTSADDEQV